MPKTWLRRALLLLSLAVIPAAAYAATHQTASAECPCSGCPDCPCAGAKR